ncbi:TPA: hypothetical protein EYP66_08530 [Candidatus Poribacteria bacterium]|nr:hypothetical protein [Candidatus Poribacteria bacterium]
MNSFHNKINTILSICLIFISMSAWASSLVYVPLAHPVYDYLDRLAVRGFLDTPLPNTLPISRGIVASLLVEVEKKQKAGGIKLSEIEYSHLEDFKREFTYEVGKLLATENDRHPYLKSMRKPSYEFSIDFWLGQTLSRTQREKNSKRAFGTWGRFVGLGEVKGNFAVYEDVRSDLLYGDYFDKPYAPSQTVKHGANALSINTINAYVLFALPWFSLQLGRDESWWGPGKHGALLLSNNSPSLDQLKLDASYPPFTFAFLAASLNDVTDKYLVAHRLEVKLPFLFLSDVGNKNNISSANRASSSLLQIGLTEGLLILGKFRARYVNPALIYFVSEQKKTDKLQSRIISLDIEIQPIANLSLYGELMADDLQFKRGWRNWGTKFGVLSGLYYLNPFGLPDTDLRLEYAFINQYAYTGWGDIPQRAYSSDGYPLGHWVGADADDLWFIIRHSFTNKLNLSLTYELQRHGEGSIDKPHPDKAPVDDKWEFLSGITESTYALSFGVEYRAIEKYRAKAEYTFYWRRNAGHQFSVNEDNQKLIFNVCYRF